MDEELFYKSILTDNVLNYLETHKNNPIKPESDECILESKIPKCNIKFRDKLCVTGAKFEYADISKVKVTNNSIIPKIFSTDDTAKEVEFIGLYTIGLLELCYLNLFSREVDVYQNKITRFCSKICDTFCDNIDEVFQSADDEEKLFNILNELVSKEDGKYNEAFTIYFMLRKNIDKYGHSLLMSYANWLMILWVLNPQSYWEYFWSILPNLRIAICTIYAKNCFCVEMTPERDIMSTALKGYFSNDESLLNFGAIEYTVPGTDTIKKITDCRGLAIYMTLSLYYRFMYNYGYDCSSEPLLPYHNSTIIDCLDKQIMACLGDDDQSKAIRGIGLNQVMRFNVYNMLDYSKSSKQVYTIENRKYFKSYYEEIVLFMNCYNTGIQFDKNINMHYSNAQSVFSAAGELMYLMSPVLIEKRKKEYTASIENYKQTNERLQSELDRQKKLIKEIKEQYSNTQNEEIENLKKELIRVQSALESKNIIINSQTEKIAELNKTISDIYSDEDFDNEEEEEILDCTIEEMVAVLNDFKIVLVGGKNGLINKLNGHSWTNISPFLYSTSTDILKYVDFYIVNTKFVAHSLESKIANVIDSERRIRYNGTNPKNLIRAAYDFVTKYINN